MAGGPTTPELVAAVANAGGLGSLAAAYLTPAQITEAIGRIRALTDRPFAVNLFTVDSAPLDRDPAAMLALLAGYHAELALPPPALPEKPAERFDEQAAAIVAARVPVFSFTFGIPAPAWLAAFRAAGILVVGTATTVEEAERLAAASVDAVCVQGAEAGGHRGTFLGRFEDAMIPTLELVSATAAKVHCPVVAAGGIMDGADIRAALAHGAAAVALGTAFLLCPECGAPAAHKAAVLAAAGDATIVTRVFSGRPARGIRNRFVAEIEPHAEAVLPFPWQNAATRPLRTAAARAGRADLLSLWAGQRAGLARGLPAAELVAMLVAEAGLDAPAQPAEPATKDVGSGSAGRPSRS
ncbi:MAG: nitronate monooxygenase [Acidobacteria bacterium]|nr:nitronate monooxygenase [Acidobacteriota bacterium]